MSECAYKDTILDMPWVLNMPNSECGRVLNTRALHGVYASVARRSEYAKIYFDKLSIREHYTAFWICQDILSQT